MSQVSTSEFRPGVKLMVDGQPYSILENEFVSPGKGQAFNRVRIKNLLTGKVLDKTFKSGDTFDIADVAETSMQYLYKDGEFWIFMDPDSFEQISVDHEAIEGALPWIQEQDLCMVTIFNGRPIVVMPPVFVILEVVQTDPGLRGDTSSAGSKPATLSTGAVISKVPLFIQIGDMLKVDTRDGGSYVSRA